MRLRLVAGGFYIGHHPGATGTWFEGEERDVPADTAAYLLDVQGHRFAVCEPEAPQESPAERSDIPAAPADRAIKSPSRRRGG
jgi:hypothetical protein